MTLICARMRDHADTSRLPPVHHPRGGRRGAARLVAGAVLVTRPSAAVDRGTAVHARAGRSDHEPGTARPGRAGAPADGRAPVGCDRDDGRHVARLLQQHPLVEQRAAVPDVPAGQGRAVLRLPGVRGGPRTGAGRRRAVRRQRRRRSHLARGRGPVRAGRVGTQGPRPGGRPPRHRGEDLLHLRGCAGGRLTGPGDRERHAGDRGVPDGEGRARDRADAPREPGHAEGLRGRLRRAPRRHDAGRFRGTHQPGPRPPRLPGGRRRPGRRVQRPAPWLGDAAGDSGGHDQSSSTAAARSRGTARTSAARSCSARPRTR